MITFTKAINNYYVITHKMQGIDEHIYTKSLVCNDIF